MEYADLFRREREARGWTQAAVARRIGVTRSQMCSIEKGRSRAGAEVLLRLCNLYGIDPQTVGAIPEPRHEAAPPDHPGVRALAADARLCHAHRITHEELGHLAQLRLAYGSETVVMATAQEALAMLQALRTFGAGGQ